VGRLGIGSASVYTADWRSTQLRSATVSAAGGSNLNAILPRRFLRSFSQLGARSIPKRLMNKRTKEPPQCPRCKPPDRPRARR
jgi:hypothetical protein